jgi:glutamyl-tRNA reductase
VAVRERLACSPAALPDALAHLRGVVREGFLLSTCNRVEVYAPLEPGADSRDRLVLLLTRDTRLSLNRLAPHLYVHHDAAAVRQLFTVAAGLDSMVVGEDQILAQLKKALAAAHAAHALGPILHRLGHMALATGKQIRAGTAIGQHHLSVVSLGLRLARLRYLVVYPFVKTIEWYLMSREARQGMMNEHMRIGHDYVDVR